MTAQFSRSIARNVALPYIAVFVCVLAIFAIGVHLAVLVLTMKQANQRLHTLALTAATSIDEGARGFDINDSIDRLIDPATQTLQWFDPSGKLVTQRGAAPATLHEYSVVEIPVVKDNKPIGSVRAMQSEEPVARTMWFVDVSLGIGFLAGSLASIAGGRYLSRKAIHRMAENVRTLEDFSANAAHELRGPLAAIRTNAEASLRSGDLPERHVHRLQTIVGAVDGMRTLTDDLLTLAAPTRSKPGEGELVDVAVIVRTVCAEAAVAAEELGIVWSCSAQDGMLVRGDAGELTRVVSNLTDNALRFTKRGGEIRVSCGREHGAVVLRVADTGAGIAPAHRLRVFERFWQAEPSRNPTDGVGLGLSIAQAIVVGHGGTIQVHSELGKGSEFTVALPAG